MKKALIIVVYVMIFWPGLPAGLVYISFFLDSRLNISLDPSNLVTYAGFAITIISAELFNF